MKTQTTENQGVVLVIKEMMSQALLNCKCGSINSLIDKVQMITGHRFTIFESSGSRPSGDSGMPDIATLDIGDSGVSIKFTFTDKGYITDIEIISK